MIRYSVQLSIQIFTGPNIFNGSNSMERISNHRIYLNIFDVGSTNGYKGSSSTQGYIWGNHGYVRSTMQYDGCYLIYVMSTQGHKVFKMADRPLTMLEISG